MLMYWLLKYCQGTSPMWFICHCMADLTIVCCNHWLWTVICSATKALLYFVNFFHDNIISPWHCCSYWCKCCMFLFSLSQCENRLHRYDVRLNAVLADRCWDKTSTFVTVATKLINYLNIGIEVYEAEGYRRRGCDTLCGGGGGGLKAKLKIRNNAQVNWWFCDIFLVSI